MRLATLIIALGTSAACACTIPVFRFDNICLAFFIFATFLPAPS